LPQFTTTIDGLNIHFIHVRSNHPAALPVIITHGYLSELASSPTSLPAGIHPFGIVVD
jgi:hypothetical protein